MSINNNRKLFFGGYIYTMDEKQPRCDAMIVAGDKISWLGNVSELSAVPTDSFEMIDLQGAIILPGFIDSHVHLTVWALAQRHVNLDGAPSYKEALKRVKEYYRKQSKKSGWILGLGWKKEQWQEVVLPHKRDLDLISKTEPIALFSKDEHLLWVNTPALKLAGIDSETVDPDGGKIDKDKNGEPTGILREQAAWQVYALATKQKPPDLMKTIKDGFQKIYKCGCVGVSNFDRLDGFEILQKLDINNQLPIKVTQYLPVDYLNEAIELKLRSGFGSKNLKIGGVKIFADGALGSQTALMLKPYLNSNNKGLAVTDRDELARLMKTSSKAGLACAVHAIGDQANRNVLDAIEKNGKHVSNKFRHRIEHCQIVSPVDLKRFAELNVIASMQPSHATSDIDLMDRYLGKRTKDCYRFKKMFRMGVTTCLGSDAPIEALNPLAGIYAAVSGKLPNRRRCYNPKEIISVEQAVRGFTIMGARAVGADQQRGNLMEGKAADFIILDRDIFRSESKDILKSKVIATYIDGKAYYLSDDFSSF